MSDWIKTDEAGLRSAGTGPAEVRSESTGRIRGAGWHRIDGRIFHKEIVAPDGTRRQMPMFEEKGSYWGAEPLQRWEEYRMIADVPPPPAPKPRKR